MNDEVTETPDDNDEPMPEPLTSIEVYSYEQAAMFSRLGFVANKRPGDRTFMVLETPPDIDETQPLPMLLREQAG